MKFYFHLSLQEALTHIKIDSKEPHSINELNAYQKLLLECEQDVAMTFKEYLNPRYLYVTIKIIKSLQRFPILLLLENDREVPCEGIMFNNQRPECLRIDYCIYSQYEMIAIRLL
jgi:hypothetical protein